MKCTLTRWAYSAHCEAGQGQNLSVKTASWYSTFCCIAAAGVADAQPALWAPVASGDGSACEN